MPDDEAARVREVYDRRAVKGLDARYDYWQPANLFIYQSRERALLAFLRDTGMLPLDNRLFFDAGCGDGGVLRDLIRYGAAPESLYGLDLLEERVARARELTPGAHIEAGDLQSIPHADQAFDLILGFTLLSSVKDDSVRQRIASEMTRIAKPGGLIVLYDFWINPLNRDARPLKHEEVRDLFRGHEIQFRGVTLAPPITRLLAKIPGGWLACTVLEMIPFLRTHFLAAIRI